MKLKLIRRTIQIAFLGMLIVIPFLVGKGITFITGTLYSMSIGPIDITDPLSAFQVIILTLSANSVLLISLIAPLAFTFVFGRSFCGWLCPQNLFSELGDMAASKIFRKRLLPTPGTAIPRYVVLALLLAGCIAAGYPIANLISAPGIISVQINRLVSIGTLGAESVLIAIILVGEFFIMRRFWCNYVCGIGTVLGFFRFNRTLSVVFNEDIGHVCSRCGECSAACQLGLDPIKGSIYPQCHNCGDCITACEKATNNSNPLSFGFRKPGPAMNQ
jgi:ferredoxin-type protein NapH